MTNDEQPNDLARMIERIELHSAGVSIRNGISSCQIDPKLMFGSGWAASRSTILLFEHPNFSVRLDLRNTHPTTDLSTSCVAQHPMHLSKSHH